VAMKNLDEFTHQPSGLKEHIVLPGHQQRTVRSAEAGVGASQLVRIVHMDPPEPRTVPVLLGNLLEERRRPVPTTVLDDNDLDVEMPGIGAPALEGEGENRLVVESGNHYRHGAIARIAHDGFCPNARRFSASGVWTLPGSSRPPR
jgi:hypothetical protein